jgi:hypothetical protein
LTGQYLVVALLAVDVDGVVLEDLALLDRDRDDVHGAAGAEGHGHRLHRAELGHARVIAPGELAAGAGRGHE